MCVTVTVTVCVCDCVCVCVYVCVRTCVYVYIHTYTQCRAVHTYRSSCFYTFPVKAREQGSLSFSEQLTIVTVCAYLVHVM